MFSSSGGTPYSLHSLDASGFEAKEFHLQQAHKPLPDKVGACTQLRNVLMAVLLHAMQRRMMHVTACCWPERDVNVSERLAAAAAAPLSTGSRQDPAGVESWLFASVLVLLPQIGTAGTFDAEAYRQSLAANVALQQQIKEKRHGSAAQEGEQAWHTAASTPRAQTVQVAHLCLCSACYFWTVVFADC